MEAFWPAVTAAIIEARRTANRCTCALASGAPDAWYSLAESTSCVTSRAPAAWARVTNGFPVLPWIHPAPISTGNPREESVQMRPPIRLRASRMVTV